MDWCWLKFEMQLGESEVSSDGKDGVWYVDIRGFKVIAPACVDWGPFIVDHWTSILLCTDHIPDLWGLVNQRSSMIVVVGRYSTIPLGMSTEIVYGPPTDSSACGIAWKTCTRDRWNSDRPYGIIVKGYHTWPVHVHVYVVLVRFVPLQGCLLIRISVALSDMSDSLFTVPTHKNACLLLWWWLINDDGHDYIMMLYLLYNIDCYLACSCSGW
jgi:hypothetical protein